MSRSNRLRLALGALPALGAAACASSPRTVTPAPTTTTATVSTSTVQRTPGPGGESGVFVATLGTDTVSVERYTRRGDRLEGELLVRTPTVQVVRYDATLAPDGRITQLEYAVRPGTGSPPPNAPQAITLRVMGDSVRREARFADSTAVRTVAVPANAILAFGTSYALYEHGLRQLRAAGQPSGALLFYTGSPRVGQPYPVTFVGADSARLEYFGDPMRVAFDREGRLIGIDGTSTTNKVVVRRGEAADIAALAAAFAARGAMGQTSPRDTVRATIGAAQLLIDYGRPSVRGRTVWGGTLVPHGAIWRTGANQATHLRTSSDLMIGGTHVPAGTYTLYTWPTAQGTQLVVNKQTGQWGTEYAQAQDLARIPMTTTELPSPVEQFTFEIVPNGTTGGTIRMAWGTLRHEVPFTIH